MARPESSIGRLATEALSVSVPRLLRIPPATDLLDAVLAVVADTQQRGRAGSVLVLVPSVGWAERLTGRLNRRGVAATTAWAPARAGWPVVVGSRAAAWAPVPELAAAVVFDAHDAAYVEQSAPTYSAVDVVGERAARAGAPCLVVSSAADVGVKSHGYWTRAQSIGGAGRMGRAAVGRPSRRRSPRACSPKSSCGLPATCSMIRRPWTGRAPLVCVYNRTGGARLLGVCQLRQVAQCTRCTAAVRKVDDRLVCPRCGEERPLVCAACGKHPPQDLRAGVTRLREELAALLGTEVGEVSGAAPAAGDGAVPMRRC